MSQRSKRTGREHLFLTSQPLCQGERVHRGPVVRSVLRLLGGLLVEVVHGAQRVHGVEGVPVHPVVLHDWPAVCREDGRRSGGGQLNTSTLHVKIKPVIIIIIIYHQTTGQREIEATINLPVGIKF